MVYGEPKIGFVRTLFRDSPRVIHLPDCQRAVEADPPPFGKIHARGREISVCRENRGKKVRL